MISKIRNWLRNKRLIRSVDVSAVSVVPFVPVAQEDMRAATDVKNFNKSFDQQQKQMQAKAMVAHEPDCDVITCTKVSCFKWEPDKIIATRKMSSTRKRIKKPIQGD